MKKLFRRFTALLCACALCLTFAGALSVEDALSLLEENYVDELPAAVYEATTLEEIFEILGDPYTYYMTAEEYAQFNESVEHTTTVTGIGAAIEYTENGILITEVLDGGGAKDAGLVPGDLIIAVDGVSCAPANESHRTMILGDEGTSVTLTVRRADGSAADFTIERRTVTILNTTITYDDGVGSIDCRTFGSQTGQYFLDGIEAHPDARSWIVDLRGNPGGLAQAAVIVAGVFSSPGVKLYFRDGGNGVFGTNYLREPSTEAPAIVLVNGFSASASEIVAGDVRADQCGIVLGSRTYGKGTAQVVLDSFYYPALFDGDALKVTAFRFYCTDGNTTDKIGVVPTLLLADEYAPAAAQLLSAAAPAEGEYLTLTLNSREFCLVPAAAKAAGQDAALTELLSALPPDAAVTLHANGTAQAIDPAEALARYGDASASRRFSDVSGSPYADAIDTLGVYGIVQGVGDGVYAPDRTLTRAELAAMLTRALNLRGGAQDGVFTDVSTESWYADAVCSIAGLGFVNGVGGGRFDPDATLTQEQFIAVMGRLTQFFNIFADKYVYDLTEDDLADESLAPFASWARTGASLLTGYQGNMLYAPLDSIDPHAPVTRAQAAATLCGIFKALHILSY